MQADVPSSTKTVIEAGQVMATLNDWRAILFIMLFVLIASFGIIIYLITSNRLERAAMVKERESNAAAMAKERERMSGIADKFVTAADKMGDNLGAVSTELAVLRAVSSRVESNATHP
jgi:uncharacterized membrane protein